MRLPKLKELLPDEVRQICRYARQLQELGLCDDDDDDDELDDELEEELEEDQLEEDELDDRFDRDELGIDPEEDAPCPTS